MKSRLLSLLCLTFISTNAFSFSGDSNTLRADKMRRDANHPHRHLPADVQEALDKCHDETGVNRPDFKNHERPKKEDIDKMKACVESKGKALPKHPGPPHHPRREQSERK